MRRIFIAFAMAALASGTAAASDKTDVMAVVHKWANAFNKADVKSAATTCADDAIIIDDFPPHAWQGSGTCANWYKDFVAFAAKAGMTDASVTLGKTRHLDIDSGYAYLVTPVTLSLNKSGKPTKEAGMVTMSLHKSETGWRITGWAWADL